NAPHAAQRMAAQLRPRVILPRSASAGARPGSWISCTRCLGRTRAWKVLERLGNLKAERLTKPDDIVSVLRCRRISQMAEDLYGCGDAWNRLAPHPPRDEAFGRVAKYAAARLRLYTATLRVEGDGMEVDLLAVTPQDKPYRQMVFV